jgi:hypothetical protein
MVLATRPTGTSRATWSEPRAQSHRTLLRNRQDRTYRSGELHSGGDQDLARRDLEPINRTRNGRHFVKCDCFAGKVIEGEKKAVLARKTSGYASAGIFGKLCRGALEGN